MKQQGKKKTGVTLKKPTTKKPPKILATLDDDPHNKLIRLALACGTNKTQLAAQIITMAVNHADIVKWFAQRYPGPEQFRIIVIHNPDGTITY